jgi:hypothetical protein
VSRMTKQRKQNASIIIDDDWDNEKDITTNIFNGKDIAKIALVDEYNAIAFLFKKGGRVIEYNNDLTGKALSRERAERMQKKVEEEGCTQDQAATVLALMVEALHERSSINDPSGG